MKRASQTLVFAGLLVATTAALAQPAGKSKDEPDQVISPEERATMIAASDADGNIYVFGDFGEGGVSWKVYYGDGKVMYEQRVRGGGKDGEAFNLTVWAPRSSDAQATLGRNHDGKFTLECGRDERNQQIFIPLTELAKADQTRIINNARFRPVLWKRQAHALARDEMGTYYYIDRLRDARRGHRVFIGKRGAMKEVPLTAVVDDSAGQIYATKRGELRLTTDSNGKARWTKGRKTTELVVLDPSDNLYLIYRELGIYGQLGVVCEDL